MLTDLTILGDFCLRSFLSAILSLRPNIMVSAVALVGAFLLPVLALSDGQSEHISEEVKKIIARATLLDSPPPVLLIPGI